MPAQDTAAFILSPSRSSEIPKKPSAHRSDRSGLLLRKDMLIMLTDFFSAYRVLKEDILHAWCWAHMRRKFIDIARGYTATERLERAVGFPDRRPVPPECYPPATGSPILPEWAEAEARLRQFVEEEIYAVWIKELADPKTHHASQGCPGVACSGSGTGLTLFLDFPEAPLDNNECERLLRTPVVGRKNFYGSGARWSGELAAMLWTILATAEMNGLNPILFLTALLDACAANGGRPLEGPELERFFPWALSEEDARAWGRNTS